MNILIKRIAKKPLYTIGKMYIDGQYFADTLEDTDRGLNQKMSIEEIRKKKVQKETAIPIGTYTITTNVISPRFSKKPFYKSVCNGRVPRLLNVPGFDGILIHVGDGPRAQDLTEGCILIGQNKVIGQLCNGKEVFKKFIDKLKGQSNIKLTIQ